MNALSLNFLHTFVMYRLPQKPMYLLICALVKINCDPKPKNSGKFVVTFTNADVTQKPTGIF